MDRKRIPRERVKEKCTPRREIEEAFSFLEQRESRREFSFALLIQQWFFFFSSILGVGLDDGKDRFVGDIRHARRNDRSKRLFFRIAILSANCSDCVYTAIFARTSLRSIISYNGTIYGGDGEIFWNFIAVESWREIYATWNRKYNTTSLLRFHFREINNCERL